MAIITNIEQLDPQGSYTYADYLTWWFDERVELIKGKLFKMSPAPNTRHQKIAKEIVFLLETHIRKSRCGCEGFCAPFDVRLPKDGQNKDDEITTVVQPDICVICDPSKLDERGCVGAPEFIVEILNPGKCQREFVTNFNVYEKAGVSEYWVIDPDHQHILSYILNDAGSFVPQRPYTTGMTIKSVVLSGFSVKLSKLFPVIN